MAKNKKLSGFYFFNSYMQVFDILRSSVKKWKLLEAIHLYAICGKEPDFESSDLKKCFNAIKASIDIYNESKNLDVVKGEKKKGVKNFKKVSAGCFKNCEENFDKCVEGSQKPKIAVLPENKRGFTRIEQELNENGSILVENCFDNINNIHIKLKDYKQDKIKEKEILKKKKDENLSSECVCVENKKPTFDEIKEFVFSNNLVVSPEEFFNYYESNGWMCAGQPIVNWKAKCRGWHVKIIGGDSSFVKSDISSRVFNKKDLDEAVTSSWEDFIKNEFE